MSGRGEVPPGPSTRESEPRISWSSARSPTTMVASTARGASVRAIRSARIRRTVASIQSGAGRGTFTARAVKVPRLMCRVAAAALRRAERAAFERQDLDLGPTEDGGGDTGLTGGVDRPGGVEADQLRSVEEDLVRIALRFEPQPPGRGPDAGGRRGQQREVQAAVIVGPVQPDLARVDDGQVAATVTGSLGARGDTDPARRAGVLSVGDLGVLIAADRRCHQPSLGVQAGGERAAALLQIGPGARRVPPAALAQRVLGAGELAG